MWDFLYLLGRAAIPLVFVVSGFGKFMNIAGIAGSPAVGKVVALTGGAVPPTAFGYLIAAIELIGGLMVLVGFKTRASALVLAAFTILTIVLVHNFWDMEGAARAGNQVQALKNLSILGGMLLLAAMGPGRYSVDNRGA